jgi:hypothetical protein
MDLLSLLGFYLILDLGRRLPASRPWQKNQKPDTSGQKQVADKKNFQQTAEKFKRLSSRRQNRWTRTGLRQ